MQQAPAVYCKGLALFRSLWMWQRVYKMVGRLAS